MTEFAETVGVIRDFVLIVIFLLAIIVLLVLYKKIAGVLDSAKRTLKSAEDVAAAVSEKVVGPAASGSGLAFGAGKLVGFVLGLSGKRRRKGGKSDGQQQ